MITQRLPSDYIHQAKPALMRERKMESPLLNHAAKVSPEATDAASARAAYSTILGVLMEDDVFIVRL
jgi:hypothetical protein